MYSSPRTVLMLFVIASLGDVYFINGLRIPARDTSELSARTSILSGGSRSSGLSDIGVLAAAYPQANAAGVSPLEGATVQNAVATEQKVVSHTSDSVYTDTEAYDVKTFDLVFSVSVTSTSPQAPAMTISHSTLSAPVKLLRRADPPIAAGAIPWIVMGAVLGVLLIGFGCAATVIYLRGRKYKSLNAPAPEGLPEPIRPSSTQSAPRLRPLSLSSSAAHTKRSSRDLMARTMYQRALERKQDGSHSLPRREDTLLAHVKVAIRDSGGVYLEDNTNSDPSPLLPPPSPSPMAHAAASASESILPPAPTILIPSSASRVGTEVEHVIDDMRTPAELVKSQLLSPPSTPPTSPARADTPDPYTQVGPPESSERRRRPLPMIPHLPAHGRDSLGTHMHPRSSR